MPRERGRILRASKGKRFSKLDGYAKVNRSKGKMMGEECSQLQTLARVHNASGLQ
jgi:hypothetical protein